jgi:Tol biopolymer transport system component
MTQRDGFDRMALEWLDEQAGRNAPSYLAEVLARTTRTRQRPAWSSLERWLPVLTTLRLAPVPRMAWLLVVAALIAAIFVAVLVAGSRSQPLPAPFGPARNGTVVYGGSDGDIHSLNTTTGTTSILVAGSPIDSAPLLSPDGTRILFLRDVVLDPATGGQAATILTANVDGSNVKAITGNLANIQDAAWSHDGSKVIVAADLNESPALQLFSIGGTAPPFVIDTGGMAASSLAFRPGDHELTFLGSNDLGDGVYAVGVDGRGLRTIAPYTTPLTRLSASLSPDGSKVAYTVWDGTTGTLHVTDVATGRDTIPALDPPSGGGVIDEFSGWSPDGSLLVFGRYNGSPVVHFAVAPSTGGRVTEIGPGRAASADYAQFSPDGTSVLAYYGIDKSTWLLDPAGLAADRQLSSAITERSSWQRLAP